MHLKIWTGLILSTLICLASIASIVAVSEKADKKPNHWHELTAKLADGRFTSVKMAVAAHKLTVELAPQARVLAGLYRQNGQPSEAAEIHRQIWLLSQTPDQFVDNALTLASIYSDTYAFAAAADIYQIILRFDEKRCTPDSPLIARDCNNAATCYMAWAGASQEEAARRERLNLAAAYLVRARKVVGSNRSDNARAKSLAALIDANARSVKEEGGL